jgi:hypothetical protein
MNASRPTPSELRRGEAAAWGKPPGERHSMRLLRWKPVVKNSLRGFCDVELPNGLQIYEIPVLSSHGKYRAALPSRPQIVDGRHKTDPNGRPAYTPILQWRSRDLSDAFSAKVVALVMERHPEAFDGA